MNLHEQSHRQTSLQPVCTFFRHLSTADCWAGDTAMNTAAPLYHQQQAHTQQSILSIPNARLSKVQSSASQVCHNAYSGPEASPHALLLPCLFSLPTAFLYVRCLVEVNATGIWMKYLLLSEPAWRRLFADRQRRHTTCVCWAAGHPYAGPLRGPYCNAPGMSW